MTVIKTSDFFDDGYKKDLQEIANEWRKLGEDVKLVIGQLKGAGKGLRKSLEETSTSTSGGQDKIKKMSKEIQELQKAIGRFEKASSSAGQAQAFWNEQTRQANAKNKTASQLVMSQAGSYNALSAELKQALIGIKKVSVETRKGRIEFDKDAKSIATLRQRLKDMDAQMNNHARNVGNYQSGLKGLMGTVKRLAAVYLGFEAFRSAVRTTRDLTVQTDSLRLAYSKIIPDSGKLAKTNAFLSKTAENYGIDLNSLRKNYLRFTAASRSTNLSMEETQAIFNSVAKAGSVMGLEAIRMDRAFNALEQMLSKGKVSSEELRQQLGDSLPGSMEIMADALDVTTLELSKMLEEGKILSEDALPKFAKQLEITYGIQNLTRVENLAASQGRLKTAVIELVESMETTGVFRDFYTGMADGVKFIARNIDAVYRLGKALVVLSASYGIVRLMNFAESIQDATKAMTLFNVVTKANPLGLVLAAITSLIGAFTIYKDQLTDLVGLTSDFTRFKDDLNQKIDDTIAKQSVLNNLDDTAIANLKEKIRLENVAAELQRLRVARAKKEIELESASDVRAGFAGAPVAFSEAQKIEQQISKIDREIAELLDFGGDKVKEAFALGLGADIPSFDFDGTKTIGGGGGGGGDEDVDVFKQRELRINAMQDGYMKELKLLELKHDREDAELDKHNIDVEINNKKHFAEIMALRRKFWKEIMDVNMKAYEEDKKQREASMKESVDDAKKYLKEFEEITKANVRLAEAQGVSGTDLDLLKKQAQIEVLDKTLEFKKEILLTDTEIYKIETELLALRTEAFKLFAQTEVGSKALNAVFGSLGGGFIQNALNNLTQNKNGEDDGTWVFGFRLEELLGLDDKQVKAVESAFGVMKSAMTSYFQSAIEQSNQLVQQRNQEVASAERALEREIASRNAGYANFVDDAQKRLGVAKKNQEEAIRQRQAFQRQQLIADSILQASGLVSAAVNIFKDFKFPISLGIVAAMFGAFAAAKVKAFELTRQEFAEGDLSIIGGGRHGSGNDTLVGFSGGRAQFAEQGEARMILSRRVTAKYKDVLPDLFESLNRGTFDIDALKGTNSPIPSLIVNARTDTSRMEKELVAIRRQGETQTIYDNGKKVVIKGNRIKRYV